MLIALVVLGAGGLYFALARAMNPPEAPRDHFLAYKTKGTKGAVAFELRLRLRSHDRYEDRFFDARQPRDLLVPVAVDGLDMLIGL